MNYSTIDNRSCTFDVGEITTSNGANSHLGCSTLVLKFGCVMLGMNTASDLLEKRRKEKAMFRFYLTCPIAYSQLSVRSFNYISIHICHCQSQPQLQSRVHSLTRLATEPFKVNELQFAYSGLFAALRSRT